jgi:hypothetical protein
MAMTKLSVSLAVVLTIATVVADAASTARRPTYLEKVTIMDAFNVPGRSFASRCVRIRVSTVNRRYAILVPPRHPPKSCTRTGQVGDGFVFFKRRSKHALHWRDIVEGSGYCPRSIPRRVGRDLLPEWCTS